MSWHKNFLEVIVMAKKTFMQKLAQQLSKSKIWQVDTDRFSDNSSAWIELRYHDLTVSIGFDSTETTIVDIGVYVDTYEQTDVECVFRLDNVKGINVRKLLAGLNPQPKKIKEKKVKKSLVPPKGRSYLIDGIAILSA